MSEAINIHDLYMRYVRNLPAAQRIELISLIAEDLADSDEVSHEPPQRRDITELRGLGKELWAGVDAQEYVNALRDEWEPQASDGR